MSDPPAALLRVCAADPSRPYLRLLGEVRVLHSGTACPLPRPQPLALLIYLHLRGKASREELAAVFWPDKERRSGLQSVRQALTQLRKQLPSDPLREDAAGLWAEVGSDLGEFGRLSEAEDDVLALELLQDDAALLPSFVASSEVFANWLEDERATFRSRYVQALRRAGKQRLADGAYAEARAHLTAARRLDPDEALYRLLMTLESQAGDITRALELFEECRQMLWEEWQEQPGTETLALLRQIEGEAGGHGHARLLGGAADGAQGSPFTDPLYADPLYGREGLRQRLLALLAGGGQVLLHGLAGLGKTRLAGGVAQSVIQQGQKVAWLEVGADEAGAVLGRLRELLRVRSEPLEEAIARENVGLLVLDNAANSYAAGQIVAGLPAGLPVLLTSRLRLPKVQAIELSRLERESSLQLLAYHLGESPRNFNGEALCALLADHPFALRLAALTLKRGDKGVMEAISAAPQDTIRALLEQSLLGLSPRSYEVYLALGSLYAPHATPELLTILLGRPPEEVEEALHDLAAAGLVSRESRAGSDTLSYRMHDLTWHAAREHRAHLPHHLVDAVTRYAQAHITQPDLLATDLPHLLGAAQAAPPAALTRLMCGWLGGGYIGARGFPVTSLHVLESALAHAEDAKDWDAASLLGGKYADILQALLGKQAEAVRLLLRASGQAEQAGNAARQAIGLSLAGQMLVEAGDEAGWGHLHTAQNIAAHSDPVTRARVLSPLARAYALKKDFVQARDLLAQARDMLACEYADSAAMAAYLGILGNLGQAEKRLGNLEEALRLKREMGALAAEKEERLYEARAAFDEGELLAELGQPAAAIARLREAVTLSQSIGAGNLEALARRLLQDVGSAS